MMFRVHLHAMMEVDLRALPVNQQERILDAIQVRLGSAADRLGKPLSAGLKGFRRLRIGDYRVIYRMEGMNVHVMCVGHRKNVYESFLRRLN